MKQEDYAHRDFTFSYNPSTLNMFRGLLPWDTFHFAGDSQHSSWFALGSTPVSSGNSGNWYVSSPSEAPSISAEPGSNASQAISPRSKRPRRGKVLACPPTLDLVSTWQTLTRVGHWRIRGRRVRRIWSVGRGMWRFMGTMDMERGLGVRLRGVLFELGANR